MHQQNGRAERAIRTIMEKAQTLRFTACLPKSYWEFCIEHSVHLHNLTPIARLDWQTPHNELKNEQPDVTTLRVFGCAAYVFIPEEKRANKLAPRSELMTYIGIVDGVKGYRFMRKSGAIFLGAMATFDETMFPFCKHAKTPNITDLEMLPPDVEDNNNHSHEADEDGDDDDDDHYRGDESNTKSHQKPPPPSVNPPSTEIDTDTDSDSLSNHPSDLLYSPGKQSDASTHDDAAKAPPPTRKTISFEDFTPRKKDQKQWEELPLRQSTRERIPTHKPSSIYGEKLAPSEIERDIAREGYWKKKVGQGLRHNLKVHYNPSLSSRKPSVPEINMESPAESSSADEPQPPDTDNELEYMDAEDKSFDKSLLAKDLKEGGN